MPQDHHRFSCPECDRTWIGPEGEGCPFCELKRLREKDASSFQPELHTEFKSDKWLILTLRMLEYMERPDVAKGLEGEFEHLGKYYNAAAAYWDAVEREEAAEEDKVTIVTAPAELIDAGQRVTRKAADSAKK